MRHKVRATVCDDVLLQVRSTQSKINTANKNVAQTKKKILGEQNRRQVLSSDEQGLIAKQHEQEVRVRACACVCVCACDVLLCRSSVCA